MPSCSFSVPWGILPLSERRNKPELCLLPFTVTTALHNQMWMPSSTTWPRDVFFIRQSKTDLGFAFFISSYRTNWKDKYVLCCGAGLEAYPQSPGTLQAVCRIWDPKTFACRSSRSPAKGRPNSRILRRNCKLQKNKLKGCTESLKTTVQTWRHSSKRISYDIK